MTKSNGHLPSVIQCVKREEEKEKGEKKEQQEEEEEEDEEDDSSISYRPSIPIGKSSFMMILSSALLCFFQDHQPFNLKFKAILTITINIKVAPAVWQSSHATQLSTHCLSPPTTTFYPTATTSYLPATTSWQMATTPSLPLAATASPGPVSVSIATWEGTGVVDQQMLKTENLHKVINQFAALHGNGLLHIGLPFLGFDQGDEDNVNLGYSNKVHVIVHLSWHYLA